MNPAECRALVERYYDEVMNQHRLNVLDEILGAPAGGVHPGFAEETREISAYFLTAFPDLHFNIIEWIVTPDRVVTRWTARGTHQGIFMNQPATQRAFFTSGIDIFHLSDGKITYIWQEMNTLNLLQQLEILPRLDQPAEAQEKEAQE